PSVEVVVAGGMVRKTDGGIVGAVAVDLIKQFKVDFAVIGASAIDEEGSLLDFDYREVRVSQAILQQARTRVLVADVMKFERRAPVEIGHLADIDVFVTDAPPPEQIRKICDEHEVRLEIAENADAAAEAYELS
ncbi:MAG: DeoR/GlpR family DNA-binding transcription regulator, partial [Aestuariivirgaceae bacterium]